MNGESVWVIAGRAGVVASILGLGVSIFVLIQLASVRSHFLVRATLPDLLKQLEVHATEFSRLLGQFREGNPSIGTICTRVHATVANVRRKLDGDARSRAKQLEKAMTRMRHPVTKDRAWAVYNELQGFIQALKHVESDMRWKK